MEENEKISFRFKVGGNIIRRLGQDSVSSGNTAVLEIIKNSFDAGAKKVLIQLKNEDIPEHASIWIEDNGAGMSFSDLESKWMNLANSEKSAMLFNKGNNRPVIGEKGIGRLSMETLGETAHLITRPNGETKGYKIEFDWKKYLGKNILIGDIVNEGESFVKNKKEHGTILEVFDLKQDWNDINTQTSLLRDIYLLNPPNKKIKDWNVIPKFHKEIREFRKIRRSFLKNCAYFLKVRLVKGNILRYEFSTLNEQNKKTGIVRLSRKLSCGDASFELYFYYRDKRYYQTYFNKELSTSEMSEIKTILNEYKGVKLYRDNFRVKPYGDPENDWIGLEIAAQDDTMFPRNHNIFGMVHVSKSKNPKIIDTTTREGVIFNQEFEDLRYFVKETISQIFVNLRSEKESFKVKAKKMKNRLKERKIIKVPKEIIISAPPFLSKRNPFIEVRGEYPQNFYLSLEEEINGCFEQGFPNATFFMCRKIVENLIYNILEKQFKDDEESWWDKRPEINQPKSLSQLINSLKQRKNQFKPNVTRYISTVLPYLEKIRNDVNPLTHNLHNYLTKKEDLEQYKINETIQILVYIWNNL